MRPRSRFALCAGRNARATKSLSMREFVSRSEEETKNLGVQLAHHLEFPSVVLLCGRLGTGKTILARGMAEGLGVEDLSLVNSPSFTLINIYRGRCPIYHVDLYRLEHKRDFYSTGIEEFLGQDGVTIVEWGERLRLSEPADLVVELEDAGDEIRIIRVRESLRNGRAQRKMVQDKLRIRTSKRLARSVRGRQKS